MMQIVFGAILFSMLAPAVLGQNRQTERDFDRIKGKAKTVVVETAQFKPVATEWLEQARVLQSSVAYDTDGNWTQRKEYDAKGNLRRTLVFSYLGKDRIALSEENSPDELATVVKITRRRIDPRYTYKLKYVYGRDGKRIQDAWYLSDGFLAIRHVYRRQGKRTVMLIYDHKGRLNSRLESMADENGNIVQIRVIPDDVDYKSVYEYLEFDSQGNWTKRVEKRGFRDLDPADFAKLEPWSVDYRTITYY